MAVIDQRKDGDGNIVYRVRIRIKGHPLETATFARKTDARDWATQREAELRRKTHFGRAEGHDKTLADLIDRYIERELPKRQRNSANYERHLRWWKRELGHLRLKDVTPPRLAEARDKLLVSHGERNPRTNRVQLKRPKSPATVTWYMASLSHALSIATNEWEWLENNPMFKVKKPQLPQPRVRFLDEDERQRLLETCRASNCPYLYSVVVIALSTGARKSEIMHLRWRDIDFERCVARLERTKNHERRALPLTHHALELVRDLYDKADKPAPTDFLFGRKDGLAPLEIRKPWTQAVIAAGIEDFRFHDLRHSAASYLAMNGATSSEIAEVLGHKTLQMVKRYAHLSDQHVANVVRRMNEKIFPSSANDNNAPEEADMKSKDKSSG